MTDNPAGQTLTGERTLPGIAHENYWFRRHEAVYAYLAPLLRTHSSQDSEGLVLDAGCGEGYGAGSLAPEVGVVGLDYDEETLRLMRSRYDGIRAIRANVVALPFADQSFVATVTLQVIEHIWDQPMFVAECARVTRTGGVVAVSTPNRLTFSPGVSRGERPLNPFHVNEFDPDELVELVAAAGLEGIRLLGLRHGPRLAEWETGRGSIGEAQLLEPYAAWDDDLAGTVRSVEIDDFVIDDTDIGAALDLIVMARRA